MNQNTEPVAAAESLAEVPEHVLRGLPEEVRLFPSAVDKTRIGVWATKPILKGKKFGPFVGDKKKRSQVKNNVYMWEVYYPNLGWMCIDATDPEKGNWLRYVNWACSGEEQNLFPLEINRAIYYKTLKPIAPGEELLVWYNGEDNPEIAAAIEEERASARSKRSSPKSRKGRRPRGPGSPAAASASAWPGPDPGAPAALGDLPRPGPTPARGPGPRAAPPHPRAAAESRPDAALGLSANLGPRSRARTSERGRAPAGPAEGCLSLGPEPRKEPRSGRERRPVSPEPRAPGISFLCCSPASASRAVCRE